MGKTDVDLRVGHGVGLLLTLILILLILIYILPVHAAYGGFYGGGLLYALLANTIIGFIVIFFMNALFNLGIKFDLIVLIFVAIFGLLAVAILIIMNLLGYKR